VQCSAVHQHALPCCQSGSATNARLTHTHTHTRKRRIAQRIHVLVRVWHFEHAGDACAAVGRQRAAPPPGTTIVITNPPFSRKQEVLARLVAWNVPFVLLLPTIVLQRDYFIDLVRLQPDRFRVVLPTKTKTVRFHRSGVLQQSPAFKSAYYCFDCTAARCACQERVALALQSLSIDICLVDQE
jgi:hypothetical protein